MLTLAEASKLIQNPLQKGVVSTFAMTSPVLERLPFMDVAGNAYSYNVESSLPSVAFRDYNESYTESTGVVQKSTETLRIFGGTGKVDRALVKAQGKLNDLRAVQDTMRAKAIAALFTKNFFKGDNSSNSKAFDGLEARITGNQLLSAGTTAGGDALTLALLDELVDKVQGGPDVLFMNKFMRRKVNALMRAAGQATEVVSDAFGRQINAYAGIPIGVIENDESGNEILDFDEDCSGDTSSTTAAGTSIYAVKFGVQEYVSGLQCGGVDVIDEGLVGVHYTTSIEWLASFAIFNGKSVARLYGLKAA